MRFVNYTNFYDTYQRGIDVIRQMENLIGRFKSGDDFDEFWEISRPILEQGKEELEDLWEKTSEEDGLVSLEPSDYEFERAVGQMETMGHLLISAPHSEFIDPKAIGFFIEDQAEVFRGYLTAVQKETPAPKADNEPGAEE